MRLVDVVVGGQWGSEGKGNIASYIAPEYPNLMRVGGPNAGHYVLDDDGTKYCHRSLPSGSRRNHRPNLLIGPGATLRLEILEREIEECDARGRLLIHPQAAIILDEDLVLEQELIKAIGSTGQGVGQCSARRILRDGSTVLARDVPALRPYVADTTAEVWSRLVAGEPLLLEGTQGTSLSLFHGSYPHTTSRDTSVSGTMSEAGIAPTLIRDVYMVVRVNPIRVGTGGGKVSGPMPTETNWDEVAARAGRDPDELRDFERGSVSGITRRVAEFDFDQARYNAALNGATQLALTFADYIDPANVNARSFEELTPATLEFIEDIERAVGVPVTLVSVGHFPGCILDRRPSQTS